MMNIHVPKQILDKYPNMEFRGKSRKMKERTIFKVINHATGMRYHYSFEEDFFWFPDQIPDYKLQKCLD